MVRSVIERESAIAEKLASDILEMRFMKIFEALRKGLNLNGFPLTEEEERIAAALEPAIREFNSTKADLLKGNSSKEGKAEGLRQRNLLVRFTSDVPAIMGLNMKAYGPFKAEDVAYLPYETATILIRQKAVVEIREDLSPGQRG